MNIIDPNSTPQDPCGRTTIEREYDAIVALAIAHPDTEIFSNVTATWNLSDISNSQG